MIPTAITLKNLSLAFGSLRALKRVFARCPEGLGSFSFVTVEGRIQLLLQLGMSIPKLLLDGKKRGQAAFPVARCKCVGSEMFHIRMGCESTSRGTALDSLYR
jgi:hypothetical protein